MVLQSRIPIALVLGVLLVALLVAAVLVAQRERVSRQAAAPEPVSICFSSRAGFLVAVAHAQGFFTDKGLAVTLIQEPLGRRALERMFAGDCDMATPAETPAVFASLAGMEFKIVTTLDVSSSRGKLIARRDRGIESLPDIKGKRVATPRATTGHFFVHMLMVSQGIEPSEITVVYDSDLPGLVAGLLSGEFDAISVWEPYASEAARGLRDNAVVLTAPGAIESLSLLVTSDAFIAAKPRAIEAVLRALLSAEGFLRRHPQQAVESVAQLLALPPEEIASVLEDTDFRVALPQSLLVTLEDQARWAISQDLADARRAPNYLNWIYFDGLDAVKPEAVGILR